MSGQKPSRLFVLPLAIQAMASIVLIVAGVMAWGATGAHSLVQWGPTFIGVFTGGAMLLGTAVCLHRQLAVLQRPARFDRRRIVLGLLASVLLSFILFSSAAVVGDEQRYRLAWDRDPTAASGETTEALDPEVIIFVTVVVVFPGPLSWLLYAVSELYVGGIRPISSSVEGIDAMGEILKTT